MKANVEELEAKAEKKEKELDKLRDELKTVKAMLEAATKDKDDDGSGKSKSDDEDEVEDIDKGKSKSKSKSDDEDIDKGKSKDIEKNLFVLLDGLPGSGKSSALAKAMLNYEGGEYKTSPIKHVVFNIEGKSFVHLGSLRDQYPGSDSRQYTHQPIKDFPAKVFKQGESHIIAEGQRLTSSHFLEYIANWYNIIVIYIEVDENTAASRAHLRDGFDKEYKPMCLKKVMGAIRNIKSSMPHNVRSVDGTQSVDTVADDIKRIVMDRLACYNS